MPGSLTTPAHWAEPVASAAAQVTLRVPAGAPEPVVTGISSVGMAPGTSPAMLPLTTKPPAVVSCTHPAWPRGHGPGSTVADADPFWNVAWKVAPAPEPGVLVSVGVGETATVGVGVAVSEAVGVPVGVAEGVGLASAPFATTVPPICGWIPGSETVPSHDAAPLLVAG
jgi:hypothetical protein